MKEYIIATASTSDLPREWLEMHSVPFISYSYSLNGTLKLDDCRETSRMAVFKGMRKGDICGTSMINEYAYYDFFKKLMARGRDVIYLDMSEKMSVSFQNANRAAERVREAFPDQRFYVMDTRCVSGSLGLLVKQMVQRKDAGADYDAVIAWGEANKLKIVSRFTVDDLNYLNRGGRVSNASALVGSLLKIKPVLYVPDGGTLEVVKNAHGRKAALAAVRDSVIRDLSKIDPSESEMMILHADCYSDAEWMDKALHAACPSLGHIEISSLGVVIGAHTGPGLLAVFYLAAGRVAK